MGQGNNNIMTCQLKCIFKVSLNLKSSALDIKAYMITKCIFAESQNITCTALLQTDKRLQEISRYFFQVHFVEIILLDRAWLTLPNNWILSIIRILISWIPNLIGAVKMNAVFSCILNIGIIVLLAGSMANCTQGNTELRSEYE